MARHAPNHLLATLLTEADWSAGELARAVNGLGTAQSLPLRYDRTSVAHWLSGSRPRSPVPELVAAALSRRINRTVVAQDTGLTEHSAGRTGHLTEADPTRRLLVLARRDVNPVRRVALARSVYLPTEAPPNSWTEPAGTSPPPAEAAPPSDAADVHALRQMIELFSQLMRHHGGAHARSALAAYLADDTSRYLASLVPHRPRLELLKSSAQLAHLLAKMTSDSGEEGLALAYFRTALDLAGMAGDRNTYAITLRAMSLQALHLGHHRHAADLAEAAVRAAGPDPSAPTTAFLLVQRALAHAHDHQRRSALADLRTAELRYAQAPDDSGAFARYPRAGLDYQRGETLLALGDYPEALDAFEESARHRGELQHHPGALTRARQAETLMRLGQLEAACSCWHQFLDHYQWLHSVRADRSLAELKKSLRPYCRQREASLVIERAHVLVRSRTPS